MCSGPFLFLMSQRSAKLGTRLYPPLSITALAAAAASAQWFWLTSAPDMFMYTSASMALAAPRVGRPSSGVAESGQRRGSSRAASCRSATIAAYTSAIGARVA